VSGETEESVSGWTVDTLREHFETMLAEHARAADIRLADLRTMLDERYATQTKALDAAFKAAEQAVQTALASQEKAVSKAEAAADKRFEAVNEFRQQLSDQTASFPTRAEVGSRMDALAKDIARNTEALREMELRLTSRLDTITGGTAGAAATRTEQRLNAGAVVAVVGAVVGIAAIIVTIILATGH
jgi:predicted phage tail protein